MVGTSSTAQRAPSSQRPRAALLDELGDGQVRAPCRFQWMQIVPPRLDPYVSLALPWPYLGDEVPSRARIDHSRVDCEHVGDVIEPGDGVEVGLDVDGKLLVEGP